MRKKVILNSPRLLELKRKRRRTFLKKVLLYFFIFLAISMGLIYLSRIPRLIIKEVKVAGDMVVEAEFIKQAVENKIAGNYLGIFPKSNLLLYPKSGIEESLRDKFKGLKDINFSIKEKNILEISATERMPQYTWCGDSLPENGNPKCHFLDKEGFIFDEAPYFSGEIYFKFFGPNFSEADFPKLVSLKRSLEAVGLKPVALFIGENGEVKVFLSSKNPPKMGPEIIFKIDSDLSKAVENLETALGTEPLMSGFKNKYSSLLYIDLRFGNKVYFKFR